MMRRRKRSKKRKKRSPNKRMAQRLIKLKCGNLQQRDRRSKISRKLSLVI
jgi:hypothetical protein